MKWQEHDTEDRFRSHKLSISKRLCKNDLIVQIEEWNAAGDIVTRKNRNRTRCITRDDTKSRGIDQNEN